MRNLHDLMFEKRKFPIGLFHFQNMTLNKLFMATFNFSEKIKELYKKEKYTMPSISITK